MEDRANKIVSVIIVNFGQRQYLESCLESVSCQSRLPEEVVVIDNSLGNISPEKLYRTSLNIKIYTPTENLFYTASLNKGIEISKGDFVLCLNNDVILENDFIRRALKGFDVDQRIGMVSGKVLRADKQTIDSTGLFLSLWRSPLERGYGLKDSGQFEKEEYIFGVNGAVAFYRRDMLEALKEDKHYFPADYRIFYEDLDISWRAHHKGWRAYYIPGALAYHVRGATVRRGKPPGKFPARHYLDDGLHVDLIKNRYLTMFRNESVLGFLTHLPFVLCYEFLLWGYILLFKPGLIKKIVFNSGYYKAALPENGVLK